MSTQSDHVIHEVPAEPEVTVEKRKKDSKQEKSDAAGHVKDFVGSSEGKYSELTQYPDLGSRIHKHWFKATHTHKDGQHTDAILSISPVSKKCPAVHDDSSVKTTNKILAAIEHPYVHPIHEITYLRDKGKAIVSQPLNPKGSLKDLLYKSNPSKGWTEKYRGHHPLSVSHIALYGRQLLEAIVHLYKLGFPILGHIQTGNIFVKNGVCRLGGFVNTLLGYGSRIFKWCKDHLEKIDVIMFGHLIFEMCCSMELSGLIPTEEEFRLVEGAFCCSEKIFCCCFKHCFCCCLKGLVCCCVRHRHILRELLEFIFEREVGKFKHTIEEILEHEFFQSVPVRKLQELKHVPLISALGDDMKELLDKLKKCKPGEHDDPDSDDESKFRSFFNTMTNRVKSGVRRIEGKGKETDGKRKKGSSELEVTADDPV